mmetsp:Transcript_43511/g.108266  ORF Transcript_43511/g.108266 Transcript_43511/m.108266 type:complete len:244 (-) Transcript_43511:281-1012(-)
MHSSSSMPASRTCWAWAMASFRASRSLASSASSSSRRATRACRARRLRSARRSAALRACSARSLLWFSAPSARCTAASRSRSFRWILDSSAASKLSSKRSSSTHAFVQSSRQSWCLPSRRMASARLERASTSAHAASPSVSSPVTCVTASLYASAASRSRPPRMWTLPRSRASAARWTAGAMPTCSCSERCARTRARASSISCACCIKRRSFAVCVSNGGCGSIGGAVAWVKARSRARYVEMC